MNTGVANARVKTSSSAWLGLSYRRGRGIKIYPNPVSNIVYILMKSGNNLDNISFEVTDINGRKIIEEKNAAIDITYLLNT